MLLLGLFAILPLLEIMLFIEIGGRIGVLTTLLLAFLMAILGSMIVKYQGFSALLATQNSVERGEIPSKEIFDGLLIILAGGLMIIPGFLTDLIGFMLLIPPIRDVLRSRIQNSARFKKTTFNTDFTEFYETKSHNMSHDPDIIDVPYKTLAESTVSKDKP